MKIRKTIFGIMAVIAVISILSLAFITCEEDDPVCNCPNGTLHLVGESCCSNTDCTCEKNIVGTRVNGIPVTNRNGEVVDFDAAVTRIEGAFEELDYDPDEAAIFKDNVKEIRVVSGTGKVTYVLDKGKYIVTVKESTSSVSLSGMFYDIAVEISVSSLGNQSKDVRLAEFNKGNATVPDTKFA
jgi:hypothetical protein